MALRKYRNSAARTLAAPIANATDTSMTVDSASGFPTQYPYTLIIDPDGTLEEIVDVQGAVGNILSPVVRGVDGTTASAHAAGVKVVHGVSARDFTEANTHVNQTSGAHGMTGFPVDTDSTQTVVGQKTFTGGLKTTGGNVIDTSSVQTVTGQKNFTGGLQRGGSEVQDVGSAQTVTGSKTFSADQTFTGQVNVNNTVMRPSGVTSTADDWTTSATFVASNTQPIVGTTFTAPPSGQIWVHLSAYMGQDNNQYEAIVGFRIGTGSTVGGGTETVGPTGDRSLVCGMAVNTAAPARLQAGDMYRVVGLTPGATYNASVMFATTAGGKCWVYRRTLDIIPIF